MSSESHRTAEEENRLSTVGELNPMRVLEQFGPDPVALIAIAVWTKGSSGGLLEQKGEWVKAVWRALLADMPKLEGCRLLWNIFFFAIQTDDPGALKERVKSVLSHFNDPALRSYCVIAEATGTPSDKMAVLEEMQGEVWGGPDFGRYDHILYRLVEGSD